MKTYDQKLDMSTADLVADYLDDAITHGLISTSDKDALLYISSIWPLHDAICKHLDYCYLTSSERVDALDELPVIALAHKAGVLLDSYIITLAF